jgi:hypothetical protein
MLDTKSAALCDRKVLGLNTMQAVVSGFGAGVRENCTALEASFNEAPKSKPGLTDPTTATIAVEILARTVVGRFPSRLSRSKSHATQIVVKAPVTLGVSVGEAVGEPLGDEVVGEIVGE